MLLRNRARWEVVTSCGAGPMPGVARRERSWRRGAGPRGPVHGRMRHEARSPDPSAGHSASARRRHPRLCLSERGVPRSLRRSLKSRGEQSMREERDGRRTEEAEVLRQRRVASSRRPTSTCRSPTRAPARCSPRRRAAPRTRSKRPSRTRSGRSRPGRSCRSRSAPRSSTSGRPCSSSTPRRSPTSARASSARTSTRRAARSSRSSRAARSPSPPR